MSALFILWSATSFVFEVPSGAWADVVDRRLLLGLSGLAYAAGFACWLVFPSFAGFAAGFVLWGLASALKSGTFEALVYDELDGRGQAAQYPRVIGWCESSAITANLVATVLAAPLMAAGGYALVGWTSVSAALVQAALATTLPAAAKRTARTATTRYLAMLRAGLAEAHGHVDVRRVVAISSLLLGLTAYDEYFPLVAREHGVATTVVPVLVGLVVVGQAVGTALVGRTSGQRPATTAALVAASGVTISLGALRGDLWGFLAISVGYGLLNNAMLVSEARLQQVISGPARATVTSVVGVTSEVVGVVVLGVFALAAGVASVSTLLGVLGVPVVLGSLAVRRWLPPSAAGDRELGR